MNRHDVIKITLLLAIAALCIFEFYFQRQIFAFREFEAYLLSLQRMLLVCLAVWCGGFLFLTFGLNDLVLISLLFNAIGTIFIHFTAKLQAMDVITLLAGVTVGKSAIVLLQHERGSGVVHATRRSSLVIFLLGVVLLLAFSSLWHLDMSGHSYHGPRWMGLWDNPNIYGMLMAVGLLLAAGLFIDNSKLKIRNSKLTWFLGIAAGIMAVGLLFGYSRGSWLGASVGFLYLAKRHRKFKWRFLLPILFIFAAVVYFFWNTPRAAPWYLQRLDFSRGSVQHRLVAWKAGFEIIRDHPFGVGWNNTLEVYQKNYSFLKDGAGALITNDYLMLGTQSGIPALVCFITYVALQLGVGKTLRAGKWPLDVWKKMVREDTLPVNLGYGHEASDSTQIACHAAVLAMLVEFWFDGGLFKLATASLFWILLELGHFCKLTYSSDAELKLRFPKS